MNTVVDEAEKIRVHFAEEQLIEFQYRQPNLDSSTDIVKVGLDLKLRPIYVTTLVAKGSAGDAQSGYTRSFEYAKDAVIVKTTEDWNRLGEALERGEAAIDFGAKTELQQTEFNSTYAARWHEHLKALQRILIDNDRAVANLLKDRVSECLKSKNPSHGCNDSLKR